jgi:hypothetical protein
MIASPSAKFARPRVHISLVAKPYERRSVLIVSASEACKVDPRNAASVYAGRGATFYTRTRVNVLVERKEMRWVDKFHNVATYTEVAAGQWQKTRSGPVCTMQLKVGAKGRYVPAQQREPEVRVEELAVA